MQDIAAKELQGHNILALERFKDETHHMIEFLVNAPTPYGQAGDEVRLFMTDAEYKTALSYQQSRKIKIKRYAHVIEGHIVLETKKKRRRS